MSEKSSQAKGLDFQAAWQEREQARREQEIERQVRHAWAEGFKEGGEEEAKRRMIAKMRELNPENEQAPAESDAS